MHMKPQALAGLLGITTRRLGQLHEEGIAVKVDRGLYDAAATVQAMLAHAGGKAAGKAVELDFDRERARLAAAQADGHELKNAVTRGELVPVEDVEREWGDVLRKVRASMLAVTSRVRQRISGMDTAQAAILDREIRDALEALSDDQEYPPPSAEGAASSAPSAVVDVDGEDRTPS
jgi:phage terminase Nu1 subunit (DNA packaging protein)